MIKLYDLLTEQMGRKPKAIILAGAPGAGKGTVLKGLDLSGLKVLNVDNIFIDKLKKANVTLDLKNATPEERSEQAKLMAASNKEFKGDLAATIEGKESFVLDGTAASYKQTAELKSELEAAGYDVMMFYVHASLERVLQQNQDRFEKSGGEDRSLAPAIVMRTWMNVVKNYEPYRELFGGYATSKFGLVSNTLDGDKLTDVEDIITKYLTPFKPTGTKEKTPAQKARSDKQYAEMKDDIQKLLDSKEVEELESDSLSKEEAQMRINDFLSL